MFTPDILVRRAAIVKAIRAYFDGLGFTEVETAVRIAAPAPEPHIDCPIVSGPPSSADGAVAKEDATYLRASPELQMKKLLAAGMDRIYQIGPCFREGERGTRHNPEFTMIEWYRRGEDYLKIAEDLKGLLSSLVSGLPSLVSGISSPVSGLSSLVSGISSHVSGLSSSGVAFTTLTVRDAYLRFAGWDPWAAWDADRFDFDMATKIEPALKTMGAVFLMDYPPQAASLARLSEISPSEISPSEISPSEISPSEISPSEISPSEISPSPSGISQSEICNLQFEIHQKAERWEFYWNGLELANCFTELCDAGEQRRRFAAARAERRRLGEADYPLDERFLETLPAIGSAAGVALGVDRLVMVLTDSPDISSVRAPE